jgi:hypothetical protein
MCISAFDLVMRKNEAIVIMIMYGSKKQILFPILFKAAVLINN